MTGEQGLADLVQQVATRLLATGAALVTAESCTGGWVGKACTDLPGSSRWFRGGAIVYGNELKMRLLGVREGTLACHGAVSEATVHEMVQGALERLGGTIGVAVSGVAGPEGGSPDKPVGTVWFAWATKHADTFYVDTEHRLLRGSRDEIRRQSVELALRGVLQRS
jgi:nicotinamide-nucleotide amidase